MIRIFRSRMPVPFMHMGFCHGLYRVWWGFSKLVWYIALFLRFENPLDMRMLVTINSHGDDLPLSIWQIFLIIYKMAVTRLTLRVLRIFPSTQIIGFDKILWLLRISVWDKAERIICLPIPGWNENTTWQELTLIIN